MVVVCVSGGDAWCGAVTCYGLHVTALIVCDCVSDCLCVMFLMDNSNVTIGVYGYTKMTWTTESQTVCMTWHILPFYLSHYPLLICYRASNSSTTVPTPLYPHVSRHYVTADSVRRCVGWCSR